MTENTDISDLSETLQFISSSLKQLDSNLAELPTAGAARTQGVLRSALRGLDRATKQAQSNTRNLGQLLDLVRSSALISTSLDLDKVLEEVMDNVITLTGAERVYIVLREADDWRVRASRNWDRGTVAESEIVISRGVIEAAVAEAAPIVTTNAGSDKRFQARESVMHHGLRSILCIPLILQGHIIGVLYADNRIQQGIFIIERIPLLVAFGTQAAIAIEKARLHGEVLKQQRMAEEMTVGRQIQLSMLPKACPVIAGWEFTAVYKAARMVGGDFYDFFDLSRNLAGGMGVVIADVADKGVPAALFMALSRIMIRTTALTGVSPSEALTQANGLIMQNSESNLFLSAFYAAIETSSGRLIYANAGHNHPLWWRAADASISDLAAPGIIMGLFDAINLEDREVMVDHGDVLVFYTDGVTEAMDNNDHEFGDARLHAAIAASAQGSAQDVLDTVVAAVRNFTGNAPQSDDFTMVVVKRNAL